MSFKAILVHADPLPAHAMRLRCAANLADTFDATLIGLGAEGLGPSGGAGAPYDPAEQAWINARRYQIKEGLIVAEAHFRQAAGGRRQEWRAMWAEPTEAMAGAARAADLIVVGGDDPARTPDPSRAVDVGRLILTAGRPVLRCPIRGDQISPSSALVAWKDTRECRRALADALPFLQRAEDVVVLEIRPQEDMGCAAARVGDVASALQRHGVTARPRVTIKSGSTFDTLMEQADLVGAGLIVAGAYGHSRLGEWAFGGVTNSRLRQDSRFVLLSH